MTAPEHAASHDVRLRRAVADLSACAIEDIEAIWSALSHSEREQLGPLLAEAAHLAPGNLSAAGVVDTAAPIGTITCDESGPGIVQRITHLGETLPNELLSRLLFCVDRQVREIVVEALPPERRALIVPAGHAYEITQHARKALRTAAFAASAQLSDSPDVGGMTPVVEPLTLRQRMRRWIGRPA